MEVQPNLQVERQTTNSTSAGAGSSLFHKLWCSLGGACLHLQPGLARLGRQVLEGSPGDAAGALHSLRGALLRLRSAKAWSAAGQRPRAGLAAPGASPRKAKVEALPKLARSLPPDMPAPRGALVLLLGAALRCCWAPEPAPARLGCWFVEEAGGGGALMPSALRQRRALLLLPPPGRRLDEARLEEALPPEVEHGLAFQVLDASGSLWGGRGAGADPDASCEISAFAPREAHVRWAAGLGDGQGCPRALERGGWFIATLQSPERGYGVSSVLHEEPPSGERDAAARVTSAAAVLSVFTRTSQLQSRLGQDVLLDCGFSAPAAPFSVEWRHQHQGAGRVVLAYDGATRQISVAEEGAELFLDPGNSNVSMQLRDIGVRHEGTYICTVYLPHLHAQQAMELKVVEPPKVTLRPVPLLVHPGAHAELACEVTDFYPLDATVTWKRLGPQAPQGAFVETWESGHRQSSDGTYGFTSFARLMAAQPNDHGTSYSCHVAHHGLGGAGLRKTVELHVAGSSGPSLEDAIGCFLLAFVTFGILQAVFKHAFGGKTKAEKQE